MITMPKKNKAKDSMPRWKHQLIIDVKNIEIPKTQSVFKNGKIGLTNDGDDLICSGSSGVVSG